MAAVPELRRATAVEPEFAPGVDATRELYDRYASMIFRYCRQQLRSREEAEDAVQMTFMNAFRGLARGVRPDVEAAWLYKIASNVCLAHRRSSRRRQRIEAPADLDAVIEVVGAPSFAPDELVRLEDAVGSLPPLQRRAILLREWRGLSYREIATELDVSLPTVQTLIFRARRALAQALREGPATSKLRHARRVLDVGWLLPALKALCGAKAAEMTVAVVSAAGVAVWGGDELKRVLHDPLRAAATADVVTVSWATAYSPGNAPLAYAGGSSGEPEASGSASTPMRSLDSPFVPLAESQSIFSGTYGGRSLASPDEPSSPEPPGDAPTSGDAPPPYEVPAPPSEERQSGDSDQQVPPPSEEQQQSDPEDQGSEGESEGEQQEGEEQEGEEQEGEEQEGEEQDGEQEEEQQEEEQQEEEQQEEEQKEEEQREGEEQDGEQEEGEQGEEQDGDEQEGEEQEGEEQQGEDQDSEEQDGEEPPPEDSPPPPE